MANIQAAFIVKDGIGFDETTTGIFAGTVDPRVGAGEPAPIGSLFLRDTGELFIKVGAADTAWEFIPRQPDITFDGLAPTTTKGDLIVRAAAGNVRLAVGADNYVLTADSSTPTGIKWVKLPSVQIAEDSGEPTGFINRADSTLAFDEGTRTFTIAPTAAEFQFYVAGKRFIKASAEGVVLPNVTGLYYIFYDGAGTLTQSTLPYNPATNAPVSIIYWNAATSRAVLFAEERHGITMDWATHEYLHRTRGAVHAEGLAINNFTVTGDGSAAADAQLGIDGGTFFDEDIKIHIVNSAAPAAPFEQALDTPAKIPVIYRLGGGEWARDAATTFPLKVVAGGPAYNLLSAGTWSTPAVSDNSFFAMWLLATNDVREPVVALLGNREDPALDQAKSKNTWPALGAANLPFLEFRPLYRLIFEHRATFTNAVKARLAHVEDFRAIPIAQVEVSAPNDHGELAGLGDDDHPQYVHVDAARTITAQHSFAPATARPPFTLGANAQAQLITGLNADLLDGLHASAFQPLDVDLSAIANLTTIGYLVRTATDTWATRTILGTVGNISVTNGSGAGGNTIIDLISTGVTPGTYTKLTIDAYGRATAGANPTTLAGYGILDAQPLNTFLTAISGASASGIMVKDGNALLLRSIGAASSKISVTNQDGTTGNIILDLGTVTLDDLFGVVISNPSVGESLTFNGTNWVNLDARLKLYAENPVSPSVPVATGANAIALGSEATALADDSLAIGKQSLSRFSGITQANGRFGSQGDAQAGKYLLRATSINASQTELFLDGTGGSQRLTLPSDSTWLFTVTVVGHRTDATDGHAGYRIKGVVYRQGMINIALLGAPTKEILAETDSSWDAFVEVNTDSLVIKVIGEIGKTIRWLAVVETVEITN